MIRKISLTALVAASALGACSSGDLNIAPATTVTNSNNTPAQLLALLRQTLNLLL